MMIGKALVEKTLTYLFNQIKTGYQFKPNIDIPAMEVHSSRMLRHYKELRSSKAFQKFEKEMESELNNIIDSLNRNR